MSLRRGDNDSLLLRVPMSSDPYIPLIIGHRGASAIAPENTLTAFERALQDGADGIELDVRLAHDGVPVVIHDATLRRTGLRNGIVAAMSSTRLSEVDVGTWFNLRFPAKARAQYALERIPTLAQVFETFAARCRALYVEMKCEEAESSVLASKVAELVRAYSAVNRVVVESFAHNAIKEIKRIAPEIRTAALFERRFSRPTPLARAILAQAARCEADEIALHYSLATRRTIEAARREEIDVVVWTVDNPQWMRRSIKFGLRTFITNQPAQMRAGLTQVISDE